MVKESFLLLFTLVALATSTKVYECGTRKALQNDTVKISDCSGPPCNVKKRKVYTFEQKFVPDHEIRSLKTSVQGIILGVPLPFPGVDGKNACRRIFLSDGTKAECPLKAGTEYIYKEDIRIEPIYPTVSLVVHWGLIEKNRTIVCFEVPARIIN